LFPTAPAAPAAPQAPGTIVIYMKKYICMIGNPSRFRHLGRVPMGVGCHARATQGTARACARERNP
jgi:hypothetical protein